MCAHRIYNYIYLITELSLRLHLITIEILLMSYSLKTRSYDGSFAFI